MKDPTLDDADGGLASEVTAEETLRDLRSALNQ
jgi:hypothetical protein